ncbi:Papain-like cysteine peptidase superfamily [Arabidopsis thaliana x Arabidopsis arenosa]|nr:Papain-like cysteine peptidase superfamily [Arabidopsis thaliana x Arabidopsis arenosa]KAG7543000.1 Papain-like cysteine peptidase superfamily [Arabidopsis thaliana x Arabidopsis arenosa]
MRLWISSVLKFCIVSLSRSLCKSFFQSEILDGNNKYKCETCDKLVTARKQMSSILQMPNILVIQLK